MHFVAGLDSVPQMRGVLTLFEGVATGAMGTPGSPTNLPRCCCIWVRVWATGWRMHNARRAHPDGGGWSATTPRIKKHDAPLESDIDALAGTVSGWVRRSARPQDVGADTADAIAAGTG